MKFVLRQISVLRLSMPAWGQKVSLRGRVLDENGAVVPSATVTLSGPSGLIMMTKASNDGTYVFSDLAPGNYTVRASAPSLVLRQPVSVSLGTAAQTLDLLLNVAAEKQELTAEDTSGPAASTDAAANASAVVLRGTERHIVLGVIPLYVLHRAAMGPVCSAGIIESLNQHGLSLSARSVTRLLRRLQRMGYIVPARNSGCRSNIYRTSRRGRVAAELAREKIRALCS